MFLKTEALKMYLISRSLLHFHCLFQIQIPCNEAIHCTVQWATSCERVSGLHLLRQVYGQTKQIGLELPKHLSK